MISFIVGFSIGVILGANYEFILGEIKYIYGIRKRLYEEKLKEKNNSDDQQ